NGAQQLFAAALHGQSEGVELLLSAGVSANGYKDEYGCSPLHAAARQGSPRIVQMLIDAQAHLDAKSRLGTTPLAEASTHQRADAVERLLAAGARV
ncbi:ankyrin repeat protein, partial [Pavlovales sp. CCMP2436]